MKNNKMMIALAVGILMIMISIFAYASTTEDPDQINDSGDLNDGDYLIKIIMDKTNFVTGEVIEFMVKFSRYGVPLFDKKIDFYLDGEKIGEDTTDISGEIEYSLKDLNPGVYTISAVSGEIIGTQSITVDPEKITDLSSVDSDYEELKECSYEDCEEYENVFGECSHDYVEEVCDDSPVNESCHNETRIVNVKCLKERKKIVKTIEKCKIKGYVLNKKIKIDTEGYGCSYSDVNILICDSIYDGNGDGICQSGESCMKFVISGEDFEQFEKNSGLDFVRDDKSFIGKKANAEVLE